MEIVERVGFIPGEERDRGFEVTRKFLATIAPLELVVGEQPPAVATAGFAGDGARFRFWF